MDYIRLGDVAHIYGGWQPPREEASPAAHRLTAVSVKDIRDGHFAAGTLEGVLVDVPAKLDRYLVQPGDVLVACRGTVPKIAIVPPDLAGSLLTSTLIGVRTGGRLLPEVLFLYLSSAPGQRGLLSRVRSGTQQIALTTRDIAELQVPLAPMEVQRRIADLVRLAESQYVAAETAARLRREIVHEVALAAMARVGSPRRD